MGKKNWETDFFFASYILNVAECLVCNKKKV